MLIRPAFLLSATSMGSALASIALYGQCGSNDIVWADSASAHYLKQILYRNVDTPN
jgi:hypothetical protein